MHHRECKGIFRPLLPLILASASPRRRELLSMLGLEFEVVVSRVDEPEPAPGDEPGGYALTAAEAKGRDVAAECPGALVVAADTVVSLEGRILGKPAGMDEAREMLRFLGGREHQVFTACFVCCPYRGVEFSFVVESGVRLKRLGREELEAYLSTGESLDKAGAYAVQGIGAFMVESITGSYTNVVGLPLSHLVDELLKRGLLTVAGGAGL